MDEVDEGGPKRRGVGVTFEPKKSSFFVALEIGNESQVLSIDLRCCSSAPDPSIVRISISDTDIGSSLEEFQDLKFSREIIDAEKWGKCLVFAYRIQNGGTEVAEGLTIIIIFAVSSSGFSPSSGCCYRSFVGHTSKLVLKTST
ncbi:hypothetical protein Ddye_004643 [Dipteronia dyeriana]|uniref:Uncharacterized protein n=1 Tax=Dipteronia dyeriana TaxID=168575 RepID=A0AAE0CWP8_9ROSI|nr:hypothetical protein Ddye_004643 [Dipteronia dyeriana]